jgi:serine protease Do
VERPYIGVSMIDLEQVPQNYQEVLRSSLPVSVSFPFKLIMMSSAFNPALAAGEPCATLRNILYKNTKVGSTVDVKIIRNGKEMTKKMKLTQKEECVCILLYTKSYG